MLTYEDARAVTLASSQAEIALPTYGGAADDLAYLRSYVTAQATALYGVDASVFDQATIFSTSLLRDFVNRAIFQHSAIPAFDDLTDTVAPYIGDVAPLLRYPATGSCGLTALQLHNVFRSFGYETVWLDSLNGQIGTGTANSYTNSHVVVLVFLEDENDWFVQDAYLNSTLTDTSGGLLSYYEARQAAAVDQANLVINAFTGYLYYRENGVGDQTLMASDESAFRTSLFGLPYAWSVEGSGGFSDAMSTLFPDAANAHLASADQGGTYATAEAGILAIDNLRTGGLSWQAAIVTLQADHYATGFQLFSPGAMGKTSEWVTIRLDDGSYISMDYASGQVLAGAFDELQLEAGGQGTISNAGSSLADFLGPFLLFGADGWYHGDWVTQPVYAANVAVELTLQSVVLNYGTDLALIGLFSEADADGDLASLFELVDADGPGNGNDFVSTSGAMADANGIIVSRADLANWSVRVGANPDNLALTIRPGDGAGWGAAIPIGGTIIETVLDTGSQTWNSRTTYLNGAGQPIHAILSYDDGGYLITNFDIAESQNWSSLQSRYDSLGALEASRFDYDAGGWLTTSYDVADVQVWSSLQSRYNSTGALEASRFDYDAGGWLTTSYDVADVQVWSSLQSRYDGLGALEASRFDYDAGGWLTTSYDVADVQVWSSLQSRYDGLGALEASRFDYDAGGWLSSEFDLPNTMSWAEHQQRYDIAGQRDRELYRNDDQTSVHIIYDVPDGYDWSQLEQHYDGNGVLISTSYILDTP